MDLCSAFCPGDYLRMISSQDSEAEEELEYECGTDVAEAITEFWSLNWEGSSCRNVNQRLKGQFLSGLMRSNIQRQTKSSHVLQLLVTAFTDLSVMETSIYLFFFSFSIHNENIILPVLL